MITSLPSLETRAGALAQVVYWAGVLALNPESREAKEKLDMAYAHLTAF